MIFNKEAAMIFIADAEIRLTPTEAKVFACLYDKMNEPVSRWAIEEKVWPDMVGSNIVDSYINYLRRKLDDAGVNSFFIATVRGVGYKLEEVTTIETIP